MKMNPTQLVEAETQKMLGRLHKLGLPLKTRRRFTPTADVTKALREAGISAADAQTLIEGAQHERDFLAGVESAVRFRADLPPRVSAALDTLQEQVGTGIEPATDGAMIPPTDWTMSAPGTFTHTKLAGHKLMVDGNGTDWRHHLPNGQIAKRGTGAASLAEYAKTIGRENREALDRVLARVRGGNREPAPPAAMALAESRLTRVVEHGSVAAHAAVARLRGERGPLPAHKLIESLRSRGQSAPAGDLHERLRKAVAR